MKNRRAGERAAGGRRWRASLKAESELIAKHNSGVELTRLAAAAAAGGGWWMVDGVEEERRGRKI